MICLYSSPDSDKTTFSLEKAIFWIEDSYFSFSLHRALIEVVWIACGLLQILITAELYIGEQVNALDVMLSNASRLSKFSDFFGGGGGGGGDYVFQLKCTWLTCFLILTHRVKKVNLVQM